jgi:hypothetical protein
MVVAMSRAACVQVAASRQQGMAFSERAITEKVTAQGSKQNDHST